MLKNIALGALGALVVAMVVTIGIRETQFHGTRGELTRTKIDLTDTKEGLAQMVGRYEEQENLVNDIARGKIRIETEKMDGVTVTRFSRSDSGHVFQTMISGAQEITIDPATGRVEPVLR